jgi:hypothetical protein
MAMINPPSYTWVSKAWRIPQPLLFQEKNLKQKLGGTSGVPPSPSHRVMHLRL